jgi:hypothetical protein
MTVLPFEARWRAALLAAMIPAPDARRPGLDAVECRGFWPRFEQAAPWTLQSGLRVATLVLGGPVPLLLGHRRTFARLDAAARDDVLRRADRLPGVGALLQIVKLVACFAYFDDPAVQAAIRGSRTS